MQITGGKVTFQRSVQPAQYETKKAEVELAFTLSEGESLEGKLDEVAAIAQAKALELVGLKPATTTVKPTSVPATKPATEPKGKTKQDLEAEQNAKLNGKETKTATTKKPPKPPVENIMGDVEEETKPNISTGEERVDASQVSEDDELLGLGGEATDEPVTDEELTSQVAKHNAKIRNPTAIKLLIAEYFEKGGKVQPALRLIPQDKRKDFLERLLKL